MADITVTAAKVAPVFPEKAEIYSGVCAVTVTAGQAVYFNSDGKLALSDGSAAGTAISAGIALEGGGAGQVISVLKRGHVYGFTVSSLDPHVDLYISDTAGALGSDAGDATNDTIIAQTWPLSDSSYTDVVYVDA